MTSKNEGSKELFRSLRTVSSEGHICLVTEQGREGLMGKRETCGAKDCAPGRPERDSTNSPDVCHVKRNYAQKGEELGKPP